MTSAEQQGEGAGPFTTRLIWRPPSGGTAVWESRPARRRGIISVRPPGAPASGNIRVDDFTLARLRRLNVIAATAFVIGSALFAVGACAVQFAREDATICALIYFAGSLLFNTGGYVSLLQVVLACPVGRSVHPGLRVVVPQALLWHLHPPDAVGPSDGRPHPMAVHAGPLRSCLIASTSGFPIIPADVGERGASTACVLLPSCGQPPKESSWNPR